MDLGLGHARRDRVDPDAGGRQFLRHANRQGIDGALRGRIPDEFVGRAEARRDRGDVDDRPALRVRVGEQRAGRLARDQDRAGDVDVDAGADRLRVGLGQLAGGTGDAGIVDDMGERPERRFGVREDAGDVILHGHVALQRDGFRPSGLAGRDDLGGGLRRALVVHRDVIAALRGHHADGGADAPAAAGDEEDGSGHGLPSSKASQTIKIGAH